MAAVCVGAVVLKHVLTSGPFMYAGTLETTKVTLAARVASDISDVFVTEGDYVIRGQRLMELSWRRFFDASDGTSAACCSCFFVLGIFLSPECLNT